jgi:succinyl-CoA synthetase alpha subunit
MDGMTDRIHAREGMLYYIIQKIRPELAKRVAEADRLETLIIGLGGQGVKHAGLMRDFGTTVAAGVAPNRGGTRIHETIPVYNTVREALDAHPHIVAASIWRHYATARDAAIEAIEAGVPLVVLITEGIPLKDVRDIIVAARKHNTLLIGGNTPGLIFPPERIKIGMLPDVFYPEEKEPGKYGASGVTIISRSGAILYHMSDAMASAGIAQNAVIGVGGDGAIGSVFKDLVPLAMGYEKTDLVIVAGEIGGCQEELLARDIQANPRRYTKPLVALISGAHAPEGKTMGHAGAIVTPGLETGTFASKKKALEDAGVRVVNSQYDLIQIVRETLKEKAYFKPERYYERMRRIWEAPPPKSGWGTSITRVAPNRLRIRGYLLQEIIEKASLPEALSVVVEGDVPSAQRENDLSGVISRAMQIPVPDVRRNTEEDISKTFAKYLLTDEALAAEKPGKEGDRSAFCFGRLLAYMAHMHGNADLLREKSGSRPVREVLYRVITGEKDADPGRARMLEAMTVASVDHGVTPPSAQATRIASSVRAAYEVAVAHGIGAITDVHGGAGQKAAVFFSQCARLSEKEKLSLDEAARRVMADHVKSGRRIEGLGHRIHKEDPRRDALWKLADSSGIAGSCVAISKIAGDLMREVRGMRLPINVDGVIGAIVADMGLPPKTAKALFILGRTIGLSAHYFEEVSTQSPMRRIVFSQAEYRGEPDRAYPGK